MSAEEQQRIWEALASHGQQLEAMRRGVERIETAIAGNPALKQPGMVDRQNILESAHEIMDKRMDGLETKVVFATGFTACLVAAWEVIRHLTK